MSKKTFQITTDLPSNIVWVILVDYESDRALGIQKLYLYTVQIMQKMTEFKVNSLTNLFLNSVFK